MKKLLFPMLLMTLCVNISKTIAQNKPLSIEPEQVKNVYVGLIQNDSLQKRLSACEIATVKLDSVISENNKKTILFMNQVNSLNSEVDKHQLLINKKSSEFANYKKNTPLWMSLSIAIGMSMGLFLGSL